MRIITLCGLAALAAVPACGEDVRTVPPEPWADRPVSSWPDLVLTNEVRFGDTTYHALANAFLVDTGLDTVGVTVKHLFLVFARDRGLPTVDFGEGYEGWRFRSVRDPDRVVGARLLNRDPAEPIGEFSGLKDRDWLVFRLERPIPDVHPLKVRFAPIEPGEVVYAVGRSAARRHEPDPAVVPLRRFRAAGSYYYVQPMDPDADPVETSGSPVIDAGGHLVGIVSGAVGELGVVGGVAYLQELLDRHGVPYRSGPPGPTD